MISWNFSWCFLMNFDLRFPKNLGPAEWTRLEVDVGLRFCFQDLLSKSLEKASARIGIQLISSRNPLNFGHIFLFSYPQSPHLGKRLTGESDESPAVPRHGHAGHAGHAGHVGHHQIHAHKTLSASSCEACQTKCTRDTPGLPVNGGGWRRAKDGMMSPRGC